MPASSAPSVEDAELSLLAVDPASTPELEASEALELPPSDDDIPAASLDEAPLPESVLGVELPSGPLLPEELESREKQPRQGPINNATSAPAARCPSRAATTSWRRGAA